MSATWESPLGVQYVELRNAAEEQCTGLPRITRYVTFTQSIGPDERAILESIPRKNPLYGAQSVGKRSKNSASSFGSDHLCGSLFAEPAELGTPVFRRAFFRHYWKISGAWRISAK